MKVVGALRLSHDWNTTGKLNIRRKVELTVGSPGASKCVKPRLLPGGKEVLVDRNDVLELWSLEKKERIWVSPHYEDRKCLKFDFQLSDDKEALYIVDQFEDGSK